MLELWSTIHIFGWWWAHGRDLTEKQILSDTSRVVEINDALPKDITHWVIAIPIWMTRALIDILIQNNRQIQIVNFAGLMSPTITHDMRDSVGSFHALWWPSTESNFRIAHANDGVDDELSQYVMNRMKEQGILILDRNRNEHDKQMALHQALTHIAIILHDSTPWVLKISPRTSPQTVADMITYNPYFLEVWTTFIWYINSGKSLGKAYNLCMGNADFELSTPNSERQLKSSHNWSFIPEESTLSKMKIAIENMDWYSMIRLIEESRRTTPSPDSLSPWVSARSPSDHSIR